MPFQRKIMNIINNRKNVRKKIKQKYFEMLSIHIANSVNEDNPPHLNLEDNSLAPLLKTLLIFETIIKSFFYISDPFSQNPKSVYIFPWILIKSAKLQKSKFFTAKLKFSQHLLYKSKLLRDFSQILINVFHNIVVYEQHQKN